MIKKSFVGVVLAIVSLAGPAGAEDDEPALPPLLGVTATATSTLAASKKHSYEAWRPVMDPGYKGSGPWCEGKRDEGIGESLVLTLAKPTVLVAIAVDAGVWSSDALFAANNHVAEIDVATDDGRVKHLALPETKTTASVALGGAPIKQLTLTLSKVIKGRMNDSCISRVALSTGGEPAPTTVIADAKAVAALPAEYATIRAAAFACDAAALRTRSLFPVTYADTVGPREDTMRYIKLKDVAALVKACNEHHFSSYTGEPRFRVRSEAPNRLIVDNDLYDWYLAFDGGHWKLTGVTDNTP